MQLRILCTDGMKGQERREILSAVSRRFARMAPYLTEHTRRVWAAAEALAIGSHGTTIVAEATGMSRTTISKAQQECQEPCSALAERQRRPGGGRKPLTAVDPSLLADLDHLIDPVTRGDPESPLRWTCKSTYHLAEALQRQGHAISQPTVYRLLATLGYSLQSNRKTEEGTDHPDRDAQFQFIYRQVKRFQRQGQPVISVDTKKKENMGNFSQSGQEWEPQGQPRRTKTHDFRAKGEPKASPYGIYDPTQDEGWVNVGISHDTAQFAVASIRGWWRKMGQERYPAATQLLITADAGGSNGYRTRLWKVELQKVADESGLRISVCHFPPGTSKWNQIEHRLFSFISKNWRGRPLDSLATIVNLISHTKTQSGLSVEASLDFASYEKGIKVPDEDMAHLNLQRDKFHGEWNYSLAPRP
jgi:Rhodopirellula transposase DDE domain